MHNEWITIGLNYKTKHVKLVIQGSHFIQKIGGAKKMGIFQKLNFLKQQHENKNIRGAIASRPLAK